ncbi:MAG: excinuclease ABC subunit UvrA [Ruminococcaceae bacterium]|nr:excinuclease ABC subunit UvrA [Oscillospiraceae bacterium]
MTKDKIYIKGAREHNLKNIDVTIPRDQLVVITGLSGSGKSSLAFDTIYAEGQRRYVESLSSYARQFLGQMEKPELDYIDGLSPAISIDQKTTSRNPRSTVGTVTEIYDYLRLLFARVGTPHCPKCGKEIRQQSVDEIVDRILKMGEKTRIQILAPVIRDKKGEHVKVLEDAKKSGYVRVRIDGNVRDLDEPIKLAKTHRHTIEIVVDRIIIKEGITSRLTDSVETALNLGDGLMVVDVIDGEEITFSRNYACADCGISLEELSPRMFSFNSPFGACPHCTGLGMLMEIDPDLIVTDRSKSILQGGITASGWNNVADKGSFCRAWFDALAAQFDFSLETPIDELPDGVLDIILYGADEPIEVNYRFPMKQKFEGIVNNLQRRYQETTSAYSRAEIEALMGENPCPVCHGRRLKPEILAVTVNDKNITEVCDLSIGDCKAFFENLTLTEQQHMIAHQILKEINARLGFLMNVGLEYLTLSRAAGSLSGGEAQRIRLATQIGASLMGVLYILDEPSIGLHQRDNNKLLATLKELRDIGNTLIVVEHDEDTMLAADHIIDIGPGAGIHGGQVVAEGTAQELMENPDSITGLYLSGKKCIPVPEKRREGNGQILTVRGASENNLKGIDVEIPLGKFVAVTGVSGSGKSSLVNEILYKKLAVKLNRARKKAGAHKTIEGMEYLDKVIDIDQSPIGRTPRSNPATYTGVFSDIREIFANTNEAKIRGYGPGRFSFNVAGGRCEACDGDGILKIEMHFLPDVYVPCEVCKGKRYNRETLEVKYKGKSINDVLEMTVEEGLEFFQNIPKIKRKLQTLYDVGLGYIKIGQPSTTLSGGEAQRVKLATELSKRSTGRTIYILDEPTTGLHTADVHRLIDVLNILVDAGNTVVVIEHNLDVIKVADHIIDLGPEGGDKGGRVVTSGTPEEVAACPESYTGQYLKPILEKGRMCNEK